MNTRTASFLPRLVQFLLLLLAGALLARAADSPTVIYSTLRLNGAAFSNVVVQVTPIQLSTLSNSIVAPFSYSNVTRADGTLTITNCIPQSYRVTMRYQNGIVSFTNCFSGLTGTIYASDYICGATPTNGLIAYSTAQADALFALRTNAIRMQTNGVSVAAGYTNLNWSSGVTGYVSGATLVLGVSSAGSSVDTNAFQPASATLTNLSGTGALTNAAAFQPASTTLSNIANSTTLVVTNGRVGIGTNAPGYALHVHGDSFIAGKLTLTNAIDFTNNVDAQRWSIGNSGGGGAGYNLSFALNGASQATLNNAANFNASSFSMSGNAFIYAASSGTATVSRSAGSVPTASMITSNYVATGLMHFRTNTVNTPPTAAQLGIGWALWTSNGSPWVSRCLDGSTVESKSIF